MTIVNKTDLKIRQILSRPLSLNLWLIYLMQDASIRAYFYVNQIIVITNFDINTLLITNTQAYSK